ncbi:MAG: hypothetical protein GF364_19090, partial [Candidatus Lokiarchaeota archaeon]|nr:hypothetical protein [Candidatus Lokiarchaeota archaeon]
MQKIDPITNRVILSDSITCIHTAVIDIPINEFEDTISEPEFEEKVLNIRSSENLRTINLSPEEKFKAFNSWVAGIAEAGYEAFKIQSEIEEEGKLSYPIAGPLMRFMARADNKFIYGYLRKIERDCMYEGLRHEACLIANLIPILKTVKEEDSFRHLFSLILELNPPIGLFTSDNELIKLLRKPESIELNYFKDLFEHHDSNIRENVAANEAASIFPEFRLLFNDPDPLVREALISNNKAWKFKEFVKLFRDPNKEVRCALARNSEIYIFKESSLLTDDPEEEVRTDLTVNENLNRIKGFQVLFSDKSTEVRVGLAQNSKYTDIPEFKHLISDPDPKVRIALVDNYEACFVPGFAKLYYDSDIEIRKALAKSSRLVEVDLANFLKLMKDPEPEVRMNLAENFYFKDNDAYIKLRYKNKEPNVNIRLKAAKNLRISMENVYRREFESIYDMAEINHDDRPILMKAQKLCGEPTISLEKILYENDDIAFNVIFQEDYVAKIEIVELNTQFIPYFIYDFKNLKEFSANNIE